MSDLAYWIALNSFPKFGPRSFQKLVAFFPSMEAAFKADRNYLITAGISPGTVDHFLHARDDIHPARLLEQVERAGLSVVCLTDEAYPSRLKTIYDPPPVLYIYGELPPESLPHVAMVGSRQATSYGRQIASWFAEDLARSQVVVVSGLAYGIDEAAHRATIKGGGVTIAVLACGMRALPSRQRFLADEIVKNGGAVLSEFPIDVHAMNHHFPIRNRIISGLSHGTLVIEAAEKSGSLITARAALDQGRDVFAVPGPITSETSKGTNALLQAGAHVATCPEDILHVLQMDVTLMEKEKPLPDSREEALILDLLSKQPIHIDELTRSTQLTPSLVAQTLSLMELKGRTKQIGGMYYVLA